MANTRVVCVRCQGEAAGLSEPECPSGWRRDRRKQACPEGLPSSANKSVAPVAATVLTERSDVRRRSMLPVTTMWVGDRARWVGACSQSSDDCVAVSEGAEFRRCAACRATLTGAGDDGSRRAGI